MRLVHPLKIHLGLEQDTRQNPLKHLSHSVHVKGIDERKNLERVLQPHR